MTTSTTIGRATGVVMQRYQFGPDRAVELLTRVSRMLDVTLEALAHQILDEVTNASEPATDAGAVLIPSTEKVKR